MGAAKREGKIRVDNDRWHIGHSCHMAGGRLAHGELWMGICVQCTGHRCAAVGCALVFHRIQSASRASTHFRRRERVHRKLIGRLGIEKECEFYNINRGKVVSSMNNEILFFSQKNFPPVLSLLASVPVWSLLLLHYGSLWAFYFLMNGAPKYMNEVLHFNLANAGFFASAPYLARFLSSFAFAAIGDWLLKHNKLQKNTIRKSFCFFCECRHRHESRWTT